MSAALASNLDSRTERAAAAAPAGAPVIVRLAGVHKRYGSAVAVEHVDIDVRAGEFFTMLGPSGSGKTTSLRLIAGFERPDRGTVELGGRDVTRLPPHARDVNTVFQDYALFPHMTVAENIAYGLEAKGVARTERAVRGEEALRMVRLEGLGGRRPAQLSGGQRQRVALARAIVNRPRVLLLDEPLGALDLKLRQEMQSELKRLQREIGITFLYVTHDQEEALAMSDRMAVFNRGRIEQVGAPAEVYERPANAFVASFVGTATFLERGGKRLVIRPEKVRVLEENDPAEGGLHVETALLREVIYLGPFTRMELELADGAGLLAVRQNLTAEASLEPGRRLKVGWRERDVVALDP